MLGIRIIQNLQAALPKTMNENYSLSNEEIILYKNLWEIDKGNKDNLAKNKNDTKKLFRLFPHLSLMDQKWRSFKVVPV